MIGDIEVPMFLASSDDIRTQILNWQRHKKGGWSLEFIPVPLKEFEDWYNNSETAKAFKNYQIGMILIQKLLKTLY